MRTIAENLRDIRERIARAAEAAGRTAEEVRLVAVSKGQPAESMREALAAGVGELGENYIQEAEEKLRAIAPLRATAHFLGHLQRNKAGRAAALFDMVQSVDSVPLALALGRRAAALGRTLDVLLEVNVSGEGSKFGAAPESTADLAGEVAAINGLRLRGLMGIGPLGAGEQSVLRSFRKLAGLFAALPGEHRQVLSMGMTGDFELAIAEGSTMVRIGTGIFGPRRSS